MDDVQIIKKDGVPAFVVMEYEMYEKWINKKLNNQLTTTPHEVVGLHVIQGMSLLKAWRIYLNLTQNDLAEKAKVTQAQVANFENGKQIPRSDTLIKISNALGVRSDLLLG